MMLPGTTISPPNFLTPRRRPALSRPLRDEPPAFLCAMANAPQNLLGAGRDGIDAQHGQVLAMAVLAAVIVTAALLEDDDLVAAGLLDDGRAHRGAGDSRSAGLGRGALADEEHVGKLNRGAGLGGQ